MELKYGLGWGIRTPLAAPDTLLHNTNTNATEIAQGLANADTYENPQNTDSKQNLTVPKHSPDTILHQKCALCVPKNLPDDLKELITKWPSLPDNIRDAIRLLVKSVTGF